MNSVVIANYRWKGHHLTHILAVAEMMHARGKSVHLHLPGASYASREWRVHSRESSEGLNRLRPLTQDVSRDREAWVSDVMAQAREVEAETLFLPWAHSLAPHLLKYKKMKDVPHVHLLHGRYPPGLLEYASGPQLAKARQSVAVISELTATGFACVGSLCAAIDPLAGTVAAPEAGGVRWIVDPVESVSDLTRIAARARLGLEATQPYVVLLGDLSARKKAEETVRVWPEIHKRTGMVLVLAGEIDQTAPNLLDLARARSECVLPDFGYLSNENFKHYVAAADVVLGTFQPGTYVSSGVSGIAAVTGTPMFLDGNHYLEGIEGVHNFGVVGDIESPAASELLNVAKLLDVQAVPLENVNYERFFHQWCESCV